MRRTRPFRRPVLMTAVLLAAMSILLGACSGEPEVRDPQQILDAAAVRLAAAETLHVSITAADLPDDGSVLSGAEGDARRPDEFGGTLSVRTTGVSLDVDVLSTGGQVYAQLPFTSSMSAIDPADLGFSDPAALIDADAGIGRLLDGATDVAAAPAERVDGEALDAVTANLPGTLVADLLTSADPEQVVAARLLVAPDSDELRVVELVGPFYDADAPTTYTVTLTAYDEPVELATPPTDE